MNTYLEETVNANPNSVSEIKSTQVSDVEFAVNTATTSNLIFLP